MRASVAVSWAVMCVAWWSHARAQAVALPEFAATRYAVLPQLTLDERPALCGPFLQALVDRFVDGRSLDLAFDRRSASAVEPLDPSRVYRLGDDGLVDACRVEILPVVPSFVPTPSFDRFVASARAILGDSLSCSIGRDDRESADHELGFEQIVWAIRFRPWTFAGGLPPAEAGDAALLDWSRTGLWRWRSVRALRELRDVAAPDLVRMYTEAFGAGPEVAAAWAEAMLAHATASTIRFAESDAFDYTELHVKLLEGAPAADVSARLPRRYESSTAVPRWGSREPDLFFALEHPNLVQLILERGAHVDQPNSFGKTALMYAAEFDLPDTAQVLLQAGADPNARTVAKPTIACNPFERIGRTPLMYAAEHADEDMLALLIAAGADPSARDYEDYYIDGVGRPSEGLVEYLARNTRLSLDDKQRIEQRWQLR